MKSRRSRRLAWNLVMLGVAALFAFEFLRQLHMQTLLPFDNAFHEVMWSTPWNVKLRLTASGWYVGLAWSVMYVFYFAVNSLRALTTVQPMNSNLPG